MRKQLLIKSSVAHLLGSCLGYPGRCCGRGCLCLGRHLTIFAQLSNGKREVKTEQDEREPTERLQRTMSSY